MLYTHISIDILRHEILMYVEFQILALPALHQMVNLFMSIR